MREKFAHHLRGLQAPLVHTGAWAKDQLCRGHEPGAKAIWGLGSLSAKWELVGT